MELMDGGELFERISQQKYFTEQLASKYTKQVCSHRGSGKENLKKLKCNVAKYFYL